MPSFAMTPDGRLMERYAAAYLGGAAPTYPADIMVKGRHVDDAHWNAAQKAVAHQYHLSEQDGDRYWRRVQAVYQRMEAHSGSRQPAQKSLRPSIEDKVYTYLRQNYPDRVLGWVKRATWQEIAQVPLSHIDMARRPGGRNPAKLQGIEGAIREGKPMEPVVLVNTGAGKYAIADGYHRTLAFQHTGKKTIAAYVGTIAANGGPWDRAMHDAKLNKAAALLKSSTGRRLSQDALIEELAESIHNIWMGWAAHTVESVDAKTRKRWGDMMKPYDDLPDGEKQKDRVEAMALLDMVRQGDAQKSQGGIIGLVLAKSKLTDDLQSRLRAGEAHWVTVKEGPLEGRHLLIEGARPDKGTQSHGKILAGHGIPAHVIEKLGAKRAEDVKHEVSDHDPKTGLPLGTHGIRAGQTVTYQRPSAKKALTGVVEKVSGDILSVRVHGSLVQVDAKYVVKHEVPKDQPVEPRSPNNASSKKEVPGVNAVPPTGNPQEDLQMHNVPTFIMPHRTMFNMHANTNIPMPADADDLPATVHFPAESAIKTALENTTDTHRINNSQILVTRAGFVTHGDAKNASKPYTAYYFSHPQYEAHMVASSHDNTVWIGNRSGVGVQFERTHKGEISEAELETITKRLIEPIFQQPIVTSLPFFPKGIPDANGKFPQAQVSSRGEKVTNMGNFHILSRGTLDDPNSYHVFRVAQGGHQYDVYQSSQSIKVQPDRGPAFALNPAFLPKVILYPTRDTNYALSPDQVSDLLAIHQAVTEGMTPSYPSALVKNYLQKEMKSQKAKQAAEALTNDLAPYGVANIRLNDISMSAKAVGHAKDVAKQAFQFMHKYVAINKVPPVNLVIGKFERRLGRGVLAYYTPHNHTLTLANSKGYGPFFHEYGHSLDHGLARASHLGVESASLAKSGPWKEFMNALREEGSAHAAYIKEQESIATSYEKTRYSVASDIRKDLFYVKVPTELFARFFEEWTRDRMRKDGIAIPKDLDQPVQRERWQDPAHKASWDKVVRLFEAALNSEDLLKSLQAVLGLLLTKSHEHVGRHTNGRFVPKDDPAAWQGETHRWRKQMGQIGFLSEDRQRVSETEPDGLDVAGQETAASPPRPFPYDVPNRTDAPTSMAASQAGAKRQPLTREERDQVRHRFGRDATQCSFARDKDGVYAYTHRARSKSYPHVLAVPKAAVRWIASTG